jgi:wyosine [tRNA(Phe)-imidazoG37] synthetase (radical SAM superfamily)
VANDFSKLSVTDHSRDSAGLRYVYPVVSRRAGGVSVGINLNTNNACNWRCIYCQVPDLSAARRRLSILPCWKKNWADSCRIAARRLHAARAA